MHRSAVRSRRSCVPFSCQTTIIEAKISISESRPNPARATERAVIAAATIDDRADHVPRERDVLKQQAAPEQIAAIACC